MTRKNLFNKTTMIRCGLLLSIIFIFSACAGPKLTHTQIGDIDSGLKINDVLVLSLIRNKFNGEMLDDKLVKALADENVTAVQSYKISDELVEETKESVLRLVQKSDAAAILIVTIGERKEKTMVQNPIGASQADVAATNLSDSFFPSQQKGSVVTKTNVSLNVNVFDIQTEKLLWSAGLKAMNPKGTQKYYKKASEMIVRAMKKDGVI